MAMWVDVGLMGLPFSSRYWILKLSTIVWAMASQRSCRLPLVLIIGIFFLTMADWDFIRLYTSIVLGRVMNLGVSPASNMVYFRPWLWPMSLKTSSGYHAP